MRILIDIGHPAHVHYYRNLAKELENIGHKVFWTVKDIDIIKNLLTHYGFKYKVLPPKSDGIIGKIWKQLLYDLIILYYCLKNRIDIAIGTSVSIAHISKITKISSIVFDDDDDSVQPLVTKFVNPFASSVLSPKALEGKRKRKDTIYYAGYHELAYLHPNRFTPDESLLHELGIKADEVFFIMRFNVFKAHHDIGVVGLTLEQKLVLIEILKPYGKIFITTERNIEPELKQYQLKVGPEKIHSLMAYATIFLGDSQTMTSEAAVLGIPSLRCNSFAGQISYLEEEEHTYNLTYAFLPNDFEKMVLKLKELLHMENLKEVFKERKQIMLADKIDVTSFWCWFVENYPESKRVMKENPEYQYRFK